MRYRQLFLIVVLTAVTACDKQAGHTASADDCRDLSGELARLQAKERAIEARVASIRQMNEGILEFEKSNLLGAERAMIAAIEADPTYVDAYLNLGKFYRMQHEWVDAETMFRSAIANMGDEPRADCYFELGAILTVQGQQPGTSEAERRSTWREAITVFAKATDIDPDHFIAHYQIGVIHERLDEPEEADKAYRKCLEINASYGPCFVSLGNMYIDYGFANLGMAVLETGSHVNPEDADIWNGMGRALLNLNRPTQAITAYQRARRLQPDQPDILFGLGMAYAEIPMREEATAVLNEFIAKAGDAPDHIIRAAQDTILRMQSPL